MLDIKEVFAKNGIEITDEQVEKLNLFYNMLIETNKIHNLTTITEYDEVIIKHFLDCAVLCPHLGETSTICDIGAGAGFPGIVIKILKPKTKMLLVDSLNKRVTFLKEVASALKLEDVTALHSRAEDLPNNYKNKYDYVVARAVAPLVTLTEYCLPFVKVGGQFIAMKSSDADNELAIAERVIRTLGGSALDCVNVELVGTDIFRKLIIIEKISKCMEIYPRSKNLPRLRPLL